MTYERAGARVGGKRVFDVGDQPPLELASGGERILVDQVLQLALE